MLDAPTLETTPRTGNALRMAVRGGLLLRGTTLAAWCYEHGVKPSWAFQVLDGRRDGAAARRLIRRLKRASGLPA